MPVPEKLKISPAQALLLLIEQNKNHAYKSSALKKLYLSGVQSKGDSLKMQVFLQDSILAPYTVAWDYHTINEDPTRRYFETHLAYESLAMGLKALSKTDLIFHYESLKRMLHPYVLVMFDTVLEGHACEDSRNEFKEYSDYIAKIKAGKIFQALSTEDREKIALLVKCAFLGFISAQYVPLPLNIYGYGVYHPSMRGKQLSPDQLSTRNHHLGLMKGHMPLPKEDIAFSEEEIPYLKPCDQAFFDPSAWWVRFNFSHLVHPFSNSISGTMLCQLRSHMRLKLEGCNIFATSERKMILYSQLLTSAMTYGSGGHSLFEYAAPFSLPLVRHAFGDIPGFSSINLESMYLKGNEDAFDNALTKAIQYNQSVITRSKLNSEIRCTPRFFNCAEKSQQIKLNNAGHEPRSAYSCI